MKRPSKRLQTILAVALLLYACGYLTQFIGNYAVWQKNGGMLGSTSPPFPSLSLLVCLKGILWFPYNLYCMAGCAAVVAALVLYRKLFSQDSLTDSERNFDFSAKGTYGTSGWMQPQEIPAVLDMVSDLSLHTGTVLGISSPATKTAPLTFSHRCFCLSPLSNSSAMPMQPAPVGGCLCRSIYLVKS